MLESKNKDPVNNSIWKKADKLYEQKLLWFFKSDKKVKATTYPLVLRASRNFARENDPGFLSLFLIFIYLFWEISKLCLLKRNNMNIINVTSIIRIIHACLIPSSQEKLHVKFCVWNLQLNRSPWKKSTNYGWPNFLFFQIKDSCQYLTLEKYR